MRAATGLLMLLGSGVALAAKAAPPASAPPPPDVGRYVVHAAPAEDLALPEPKFPDLAHYTLDAVLEKAQAQRATRGRVRYQRLAEVLELSEFSGRDNRLAEWARRQNQNPRALILEGGYLRPSDLLSMLPAEDFREVEDGVYLLRLPLIVAHGATLHLDAQTRDFRLSEERGAFLVNDGQLFITGSALTGWREADNAPARASQDGTRFRPFLLAWGGSHTYIAGSRVTSLGYDASKSYGVSLSQYTPGLVKRMRRAPPTGWIIDSTFTDLWFGFYCYEAEHVMILRNTYRQSVVYGIDPHDRSRHLVIADNRIEDTRLKHGLIVSREVNDSWILRNHATRSGLSGIVLDRSSSHNVVAHNTASNNAADGFTIYESPDNLLWHNHAVRNARHGFRVRNSMRIKLYGNHAVSNGSSGVYGHVSDLTGTDRNLQLDPFEATVSLVVVGGRLVHNHSGPIAIDSPLSVELHDVELLAPSKPSGIRLRGVLGTFQNELLDLLVRQRVPVVIEPAEKAGRGT